MENMNNNMNDNLNNINDNNDRDNKKNKKKMSFKKGAGIALCAVLVGGLAFEGVSAVNGWDFSNIVQASDKDENKTTLLKTKKKSDTILTSNSAHRKTIWCKSSGTISTAF